MSRSAELGVGDVGLEVVLPLRKLLELGRDTTRCGISREGLLNKRRRGEGIVPYEALSIGCKVVCSVGEFSELLRVSMGVCSATICIVVLLPIRRSLSRRHEGSLGPSTGLADIKDQPRRLRSWNNTATKFVTCFSINCARQRNRKNHVRVRQALALVHYDCALGYGTSARRHASISTTGNN